MISILIFENFMIINFYQLLKVYPRLFKSIRHDYVEKIKNYYHAFIELCPIDFPLQIQYIKLIKIQYIFFVQTIFIYKLLY